MALNDNALTALDTVKDHLGITLTDTSMDSILERYINASSQMIEKYLDRTLRELTYTEYQDGRASNVLLLKNWPASAITSIHMSNDWTFDSTTLVDSDTYDIVDENLVVFKSAVTTKGYRNIQLIYTAGYSTIPADIEEACIELVEFLYERRSDRRVGVSQKSKGSENITFITQLPKFIKEMIEPYRRYEIANSNSPVWNV